MTETSIQSVLRQIELKGHSEYHFLNETKVFAFREVLIDKGCLKKDQLVTETAQIIKDLITKGKHPTLNPCIDEIWNHDKKDAVNGLRKILKKIATHEVRKIDNNSEYVKINFTIDLLLGNVQPFVDSEEIKIEKLEIQTPFYRKTVKGAGA